MEERKEPINSLVPMYANLAEQLELLPNDQERYKAFQVIYRYGIFEEEPPADISPLVKMIFLGIKPNIDAYYKRANGGKLGGRPKKDEEAAQHSNYKKQSKKPMVKPKVFTDIEKDIDTDTDKESDINYLSSSCHGGTTAPAVVPASVTAGQSEVEAILTDEDRMKQKAPQYYDIYQNCKKLVSPSKAEKIFKKIVSEIVQGEGDRYEEISENLELPEDIEPAEAMRQIINEPEEKSGFYEFVLYDVLDACMRECAASLTPSEREELGADGMNDYLYKRAAKYFTKEEAELIDIKDIILYAACDASTYK